MSKKSGAYRSYLLRCWREKHASSERPAEWRFMLQEVSDAQRQHAFGSFEQLITFLRSQVLEEKEKLEGDQGSAV